jgi:hypothetical protein
VKTTVWSASWGGNRASELHDDAQEAAGNQEPGRMRKHTRTLTKLREERVE